MDNLNLILMTMIYTIIIRISISIILPHFYQQDKMWLDTNPRLQHTDTSARLAWAIYDPHNTNPEKRFKGI